MHEVKAMKLISIACFAGGVIFMGLTFALALTRGSLDATVLDHYFVVMPRYLLITSIFLLVGGFVSAFSPHP
jgi:hypothetical protein